MGPLACLLLEPDFGRPLLLRRQRLLHDVVKGLLVEVLGAAATIKTDTTLPDNLKR